MPVVHQIVYVLKTKEGKLDDKKVEANGLWADDLVNVGCLNAPILEAFHGTLRNVYLPVMQQTTGLSEVVQKAFQDRYHAIIAATVVAIGQTRSKTLLPLPPIENANQSGGGQDKDRVHILESAVVMWSERINIALSRVPESVFNNGEQPGPTVGLDFWNAKMVDLGEILSQLNAPQVVKVLKVLEIIRSPYYAAFKSLIQQLEV